MTDINSDILLRISNDVAALIDMVGDLQNQTAEESFATQVKFRRRKQAHPDDIFSTPRARRKAERIPPK